MKKNILIIFIFTLFLTGCATWKGVKQDSSDAWDATKKASSKAYNNTKEAINEAFDK